MSRSPSSEPLVLVPGLLCDRTVWDPQIDALGSEVDCVVPDHGMSDSLPDMAARILAAAPPRFALAGHSMGGRVALEVLAQAPARVTRLALLDTGYEGLAPGDAGERERAGRMRLLHIARTDGMLAMGRDWARGMVHPDRLADAALMGAIHDMICRSTPERFDAQIRALLTRPDRTALLPAIAMPTLVLCGHEDGWSPIDRHHRLAAQIRGAVLVDVPRSGHMSTMERPAEVAAALRAWLRDEPQPLQVPIDPAA
jgi:pimeloyl-ACP methyl ester carboxylesterase